MGLVRTRDDVVRHQLLHWHHVYDRSSAAMGLVSLVSDGVFHIVSTALLGWGLLRIWQDHSHPSHAEHVES